MAVVREISDLMRSEAWTTLIQKNCLKGYQLVNGRPMDPVTVADCGELEGYRPPEKRSTVALAEGGLFATKRRTSMQADQLMRPRG